MAVVDGDQTVSEQHEAFCTSCGQPVGSGRFCGKCGEPVAVLADAATGSTLASNSTGPASLPVTTTTSAAAGSPPPPTFTMPVAAPPSKPGRSPRLALIALGALGLAAIAVAAVILTTRSHKTSTARTPAVNASATYASALGASLKPLVAANTRLSNSLNAISPSQSNVGSAQTATGAAQTALATARGAAGATAIPASEQSLSQKVQQAFDNESGYLQAVAATLANPNSSQASQLQTLATQLQSSMVPLDPVVSQASGSVAGAGALSSWANGAGARARKRARAQHPASTSGSSTSTSSAPASAAPASSASSASSNPYANGESCGNGLYAGPDTSCPFAENVQQAWDQAPGDTATVQAYSPVTGQTYSMNCAPAGSGITCSGGNNASVSW